MKATRTNPKTTIIRLANYWVRPTFAATCVAALIGLTAALNLHATVLDNFSGAKTGWTDSLGSPAGTIVQAGNEFVITTANAAGALTYSKKTSSPFSVAPGNNLEFKVDVDNAVTPGGLSTVPLAILGWVPTGGSLLANGYSVVVGAGSFTLYKGASAVYTATPSGLQNTNITISLRMDGSGSTVTVLARVYKRIGNGVIGQTFTTLIEYDYTDTSGVFGAGNAALGAKTQGAAASVPFANLQVFSTTTAVLDSFSSGSLDTTKWTVFTKNGGLGDSVTVGASGLECKATLADTLGGFSGVYTKNATWNIVDGGQVEFQVDMVQNVAGANSYSALGFLPFAVDAAIYGLIEYHMAHDLTAHTVTVNGKGYNQWWGGQNAIQPPTDSPGCRYVMTMTGEGGNCRIESRMENLSVADPNGPGRVVWQTEFVDTPAQDAGLNEFAGPPPGGNQYPYMGVYGANAARFSLSVFNSGLVYPGFADVIFSNAVVRQTVSPPSPPIIANTQPHNGSNFMATTGTVAFDVTDVNNLDANKITLALNGVTYKSGDAGVAITGGGTPSVHFALTGALVAGANYVGVCQATNSIGLTASAALYFDTFLASSYQVEVEDFNFTVTDQFSYTNVGQYIDNPGLFIDGWNDPNAYNTRIGFPEVDYHDNRGTNYDPTKGSDADHSFRYDYPYNAHSLDPARAAYVTAGVPESDVEDIISGDWMNYTHNYPSGPFKVYLRQSTWKINNSLVTLERVSNPTAPAPQTRAVLGSFASLQSGLGLFINVPLKDGVGNEMILRLGGLDTLQLHEIVTGGADLDTGLLQQNYFILVPVSPDPGVLRPVVSEVTPLANSLLTSASADVSATIANRDRSVVLGTVGIKNNGVTVTPSLLYATNNGAYIAYTLPAPLPPPGTVVTNTVYYQDNDGVWSTNTWSWTADYNYVSVSAGAPGSLAQTGFDSRIVVSSAANLGSQNNVAAAKSVLAGNYAVDYTTTNITPTVAWDLTVPGSYAATANFPGECATTIYGSSFAVEVFAYLHLTAGAHYFYVDSDDSVAIYTGPSLRSDTVILVEHNGGIHTSFDLVAATDGLYPIHIVYEEGGSGAYLNLKCTDTGTPIVVNTAGAPTAYYPFVVQSSSSPKGSWTADAAANAGNVMTTVPVNCDGTGPGTPTTTMTGGTITVPVPASPKFYRIDGPRPTKITSVKKVGSNLVIQYTGQ
jgi:hypothetical protein